MNAGCDRNGDAAARMVAEQTGNRQPMRARRTRRQGGKENSPITYNRDKGGIA